MSTYEKIQDLVIESYGDNDTSRACITDLARRIDEGRWDSRGREYGIMCFLWNWFPGGTTAEKTAQRIEDALA